jgi:hypothetical protein
MTPLELAMLAGAGQALLKGGLTAAGQFGTARDLQLTPEQERRLRELERMQARNALGMTQGERELYRSQAMTPVQAAEREAMARFGASQNIGDIGQGAAFRQQQALANTGQAARGQVAQAVAQRDADVARQQTEEKARLEEQKRQAKALERQAALSLVGGIGEAATGAAGVKAEQGLAEQLYNKKIDKLRGAAEATSIGTRKLLQIDKTPETQAVENTNLRGGPLGQAGNIVGEYMVDTKIQEEVLQKLLEDLFSGIYTSTLSGTTLPGMPRSTYDPNIPIDPRARY